MAYESRSARTFGNSAYEQISTNEKTTLNGTSGVYDTLEYPIKELGSNRYPHFAVFFINENEKAILKSKERNEYSDIVASVNLKAKTANSSISDVFMNKTEIIKEIPLIGAVADWTMSKKRLKRVICLPMPQKIRANYTASYQATDETGAFGAVISAALEGESYDTTQTLAMAVAPSAINATTEVGKSLAAKIPVVGSAAKAIKTPKESTVNQIMSKLSGKVFNKRQEQLFNNMEFRSHQFSYLFIPRNQAESEIIKQIITAFKYYMHPDLNEGTGSSLLITPAEFDIEFRYKDRENTSISRIATCALKDIDVNYTAIGEFVAFDGVDHPVAISLDLLFVEMEPLNRNLIHLGF